MNNPSQQALNDSPMSRDVFFRRTGIRKDWKLAAAALGGWIFLSGGIGLPAADGAVCTPTPSGLVGWWSGDDNAYDLSGFRHGTLMNGASYAPGQVGRAFRMDGVDDYVDLGAWSAGAKWSLEAWVNPSSTPSGRRTIIGGFSGCADWGLTMQEGKFGVAIRQPGGCSLTLGESNSVVSGTWYHLVGTCDGTNAQFYVNGELKGSGLVETNYVGTTAGTRIGGEVCCAGSNFPGLIDEVSIFDRALSANEIRTLYNAAGAGQCKPEITGPVEYWQWPRNGHWYRTEVVGSTGIHWADAQALAQRSGGYLATILSEDENALVYTLAKYAPEAWDNTSGSGLGPWLGSNQADGSTEPAGGWKWLSGENMSYTNWGSGEPNNSGGAENHLQLYGLNAAMGPTWNDVDGRRLMRGYVIEFDNVPRPLINSQPAAVAVAGRPFNYAITALNRPSSFGASGLPAGLTVDSVTGEILGTPGAPGTYAVTLLATNAVSSGTATLQLTVQSQSYVAGTILFTNSISLAATHLDYEWHHVTVSNCTLTLSGIHHLKSLTVISNAIVTHPAATSTEAPSLWLVVGEGLVIDATSKIDGTGRGYLAGRTSGNATRGAASGRSGGSYGGLGQVGSSGSPNWIYTDFRGPREPGSGGGADLGNAAGGGLIRISASSVALQGRIVANGVSGFDYYNRAASSGGGIWIEAGTLTGSGQIAANGGNGSDDGGSGGGGRVAVFCAGTLGINLTNITAVGGTGGRGPGAVGTVYLKSGSGEGTLRIESHGANAGMWTPLGLRKNETFDLGGDDLVIAGTNVVAKPEHQMPVKARNVTVASGAILTHQPTTGDQEYSLALVVSNTLKIDGTAKLDVSGLGYAAGITIGNVAQGGAAFRAGGSYGGLGSANGNPNSVYGDFRDPNELGSGGGPDLGGGNGGGLVRITASSLVLDGVIAANGKDGFDYYNRAAGSGGGIWINAEDISGTGAIRANGGNGSYGDGGSGGGGRIALYYGANAGFDFDQITAHGGGGSAGTGAVGTVYFKPRTGQAVLRLDNHGGISGSWTPLGVGTNQVFDIGSDKLVISGTNIIAKPEHQMPVKVQDLAIQNQAILTHLPTTPQQEFSLLLEVAGSLSVDASSRIDVSSLGYGPGITLGNTNKFGAAFRAGGSYGGLGNVNGSPNPVYGDFRNPNELGSGGGADLGNGHGGGLLRITAQSLAVDGLIAANGRDGFDYYSRAGGSGGGIWIKAENISGTGSIRANGGNGSYGDGGSGGGGRIALSYGANAGFDFDKITAHGGSGGAGMGAVGTVYLKPRTGQAVLRLDNHGGVSGSWTPLGVGTNQVFDLGPDKLVISGTNVIAKPEHQLAVVVQDLVLQNQATLTHLPTTAQQEYSLLLTVAGALTVDTSSRIDVASLGYSAGVTIGNTNKGGATYRAGGSYGGLGNANGIPNLVYGDYRNPNELGSGAGTDLGNGTGGGLVRIAAGSLTLDGLIVASGKDGFDYYNRAGGSGGGIWIKVETLAGTGAIRADGGNGSQGDGGSGGGGRIALYYGANQGFNFDKITTHGGDGGAGPGAVGSVYLKSKTGQGVVRFDNHGTASGAWIPLGLSTGTTFDSGEDRVVISGEKMVAKPEHQMPLIFKHLTLEKGAVLTHLPTSAQQECALLLTVTDTLTVDATSRIDVSSLGYAAGVTIGNTSAGGSTFRAGGGYGGLGGLNGNPNAVYGDYRNPSELGSGGASDLGNGTGGGLARITASSLVLDGLIVANGRSGFDYYNRAGGSGGGIWINVNHLSGSGAIRANGGDGNDDGSAGGGGRVAVHYAVNRDFNFDRVNAHGGKGGSSPGAVGTVYLKARNDRGILRLDNHGAPTGSWTPLGVAGEEFFDASADLVVISGTNVVAKPAFQLPVKAYSLTLLQGARLTHRPTTAGEVFSLELHVNDRLEIDSLSRIDVSSLGYLAGRTSGNTNEGAAGGRAGGSYGGLGGAGIVGNPNLIYGKAQNPEEPGAGSGQDLANASGGGLARITAGSLFLEGAIKADGVNGFDYYNRAGGSGGGILVSAGSLQGGGTITAHGGNGWSDGGSGGGGRVAIYAWETNALTRTNIAALGGLGGQNPGQTGTVFFATAPLFFWEDLDRSLAHGSHELKWAGFGVNPTGVLVDVVAFRSGVSYPILGDQPMQGGLVWDTRTVPDGEYELRAIFRNLNQQVIGEATRALTVINGAQWHTGTITTNETWAAGQVHIVEGHLKLDNKALVTIPAGVTIKFAPGGRISVLKGGALNVQGGANSLVTFTSLADDAVGGDTNLDGDKSRPQPGQWSGVNVEAEGKFDYNTFVEFRYLRTEHRGTIAKSETWLGTFLHQINSDIVVPSGVTLTIAPGAVLKFNSNLGLTVQSGGQLIAQGSVALPITFTSVRDDSVGGDTNGDGDKTQPGAGDWRWVLIDGGKADLNHCQLRYGGGPGEGGWGPSGGPGKATIKTQGNASLTFSSSIMEDSFFDGILAWGGPVKVVSSAFTGIDRAICAHPGSVVDVVHCTLDDNRVGLLIHGGEMRATNTIVANSFTAGILHDYGPDALTLKSSDVWNPKATDGNYSGTADQTGRNGVVSVDPKFKDAARRNYRLNYLSPCVDAADGVAAPAGDFMDAPRYDDPRSSNTGTAAANGAFADLGAYEFVETADSDLDLVVVWVRGPTQMRAGERVKVEWLVANVGDGKATGPWHDAVALIADSPERGVTRLEVAEPLTAITLGPNETRVVEAEVEVPGGTEGAWRWQVTANAQGEVFEGRNWRNNGSPLSPAAELRVQELTIGAVITNSFAGVNQPGWFKLLQPAGSEVLVTLDAEAVSGRVRVYAGFGSMPTEASFDLRNGDWNSVDARLGIPANPTPRPVYLLVMPESLGGGVKGYRLSAAPSTFNLAGVGLAEAGNVGSVTVPLVGSGFAEGLTVQLRLASGNTRFDAQTVLREDSAHALATFPLKGAPVGVYHLVATQQGLSSTLNSALTIKPGFGGRFTATLVLPAQVRVGRAFSCVLEFGNEGDTDLPVPLVWIQSSGNHLVWIGSKTNETTQTILQVLATPEDGAITGVLRPGERHSLTFYSKLLSGGSVSFAANWAPGDSVDLMDWNVARVDVRPAGADAAWDQAWSRVVTDSGPTVGGYVTALVRAAAELRQSGFNGRGPGELLDYLIEKQLTRGAGASLTGTILESGDQRPLGDKTVTLIGATPNAQFVSQSGRDGAFAFRNIPAGTYSLRVVGHLPDPAAQVQIPSSTPLNLALSSGARIGGQVVALRDGAPVSGAIVSAFDTVNLRGYSSTTDAEGRYVMSGLPAGSYEIEVLADSFVAPPRQNVSVAADEAVSLSVSLESGSVLGGTVRNPAGQPVAGAAVQALPLNGIAGKSGISDAQGRYVITGLAPGAYRVIASAANFGAALVNNVLVPTPAGSLDLTLTSGGSISGTVKDARTGLPLAGAVVSVETFLGEAGPNRTDAQGRFTLRNVSTGSQTVRAAADHYLAASHTVTLAAGGSASVELALRPAGVIGGRLLGVAGAALGDVEISLAATNGTVATTVTSARGDFGFSDLPDGTYELAVASPSGMAVGRRSFILNASSNTVNTTIELGGVELRGRVLRRDGASPASQVWVDLRRSGQTLASTVTDTNGLYRFLISGSTNVDVTVMGPSAGFLKQEGISLPASGVVSAPNLTAGQGELRVTVNGLTASAPISNAWVVVRPDSGFPMEYFQFAITDKSGTASFSNLGEQTYVVEVSAPGRAAQTQRVTLAGASTSAPFSLSEGCVVQGLVTDRSGRPVADALVTCLDLASRQTHSGFTGQDGRYVLNSLASGAFEVWVIHPRWVAVRVTDVIAVPQLPRSLDVVLPVEGSVLQGRVIDSSSGPLVRARISVLNNARQELSAGWTDAAGQYELRALPAGVELIIEVLADGLPTVAQTLTLTAAVATKQDFTLGGPIAIALGTGGSTGAAVGLSDRRTLSQELMRASALGSAGADGTVQLLGLTKRFSSWWNSTGDFWTSFPKPSRLSDDTPEWRTGFQSYPPVDPKCPSYSRYQEVRRDTESTLRQVEGNFQAWVLAHEALKESNKANLGLAAAQTTKLAAKLAAFAVTLEGVAAGLGTYGVVAGEATIVEYAGSAIALLQNVLVNTINALQDDNFDKASAGIESMLDLASDLRDKVGGSPFWGPIWLVVSTIKDVAETWGDTKESLRDHYALISNYRNSREAYIASVARHWYNVNTLEAVVGLPCPGDQKKDPKPPTPGKPGSQGHTSGLGSYDPNDKLTIGYGSQGFIAAGTRLIYTIRFENKTNATAPAQMVTVTDVLDPKLDWSTFELMNVGFNLVEVPVPPGLAHYTTNSAVATDPYNDVVIRAAFDPGTGIASWVIESIDPVTEAPPEDPLSGFLPPNDPLHRGEGYVSYSIRARKDLASGLVITNMARIVFDVNPPIDTPMATNIVDVLAPSSAVEALPAVSTPGFVVRWSGADTASGSGLKGFDVYVAREGEPFVPWLIGATNTSMTFPGLANTAYSFFTLATDAVGNRELPPVSPDAVTRTSGGQPVGGPVLTWSHTANTVTLSWPVDVIGYRLESTEDLSETATWAPVENPVVVIGNQNTVTHGLTGLERFFRLRKP